LREQVRIPISRGQNAAALDPQPGCRFRERCPLAVAVCAEITPELVEARPRQAARCHITAPGAMS
jgi:peptide/nickel transport system ATP-binding protein